MTNPLTVSFNNFFISLAANNNKVWFDENRKIYENEVKKPFEAFISQLIIALKPHIKDLNLNAKDCIFRINRDIRFSKDKTPYKLNRSAAISANGKKDMSPTMVYIELGPEQVRLYRGIYMPEKAEIAKIRNHIANNLELFKTAYSSPNFKNTFGAIRGEKNVRIEKELLLAASIEPYILNKQWYFYTEMSEKMVYNSDLIPHLVNQFLAATPVTNFLVEALASDWQ